MRRSASYPNPRPAPTRPECGQEDSAMDGSRKRRTKDHARKAWYARHRQRRFARWLGFLEPEAPRIRSCVAVTPEH